MRVVFPGLMAQGAALALQLRRSTACPAPRFLFLRWTSQTLLCSLLQSIIRQQETTVANPQPDTAIVALPCSERKQAKQSASQHAIIRSTATTLPYPLDVIEGQKDSCTNTGYYLVYRHSSSSE